MPMRCTLTMQLLYRHCNLWILAANSAAMQLPKMRNVNRLVRSLGFSSLPTQISPLPLDFQSLYAYISTPTTVSLSMALRYYINRYSPYHGLKIHTHILKIGFQPNTNISIKLLIMHLKCGYLDNACQVFDEMTRPTPAAYNYLMDGYVKHGRFGELFDLVRGMGDGNEKPDGFTYALILKAWISGCSSPFLRYDFGRQVHTHIVKSDLKEDVILFGSLLDAYVKCRRVDYARRLFDTNTMLLKNVICSTSLIAGYMSEGCVEDAEVIFEKTVNKDVVVLNAMIEGYSKSIETAKKAAEMYIDLKRMGFHPTVSTFASLIGACSLLTAVEIGQQVQCELMKMDCLNDIKIASALIDMYSKCGKVEDAHKIFDSMPERNVFSWTSMIDGYGKNGKPFEALELFRIMQKRHRITPNYITFLSVLSTCAHNGLLDEGKEIYRSMEKDFKLKPKMEHYACMVDLLGRFGSVDEAWIFIKGMPEKPDSDVWAALLSSCNLHGEVEIAKIAANELFKLGDDGRPGSYVSLSNTLAAAGQWGGVINVRESMHLRRISKDTGFTRVRKAISFAKKAHHGQLRKTGDPYLTHCIHTGRILAALVPSSGQRAVDTIVAGILHDVVDDTSECVMSVRESFGDEVAALVSGVSRLSYINQILRRHRRVNASQTSLTHDEANNLRVMLLGMVDDPRVVLIKLADRLHNMRTIYALPLSKAQAVGQETLVIWCSLASRLGLWALKAELEDLCFAVLQPHIFCQMRAELASMWNPCKRTGNPRRLLLKDGFLAILDGSASVNGSVDMNEDEMNMKDILEAVLPFDLLSDRQKRINFHSNLTKFRDNQRKEKIIRDAGIAVASLAACEEALERELLISTSYVPGMEVTLSSRLKSLYSIYSKMKRKDVGISKVYDARALRIVVGDKDGTLHGPAVTCCYSILDLVHRLWTPIDGEFDDYIVNPKPSGYQSLHTAVLGPDNSPLEVQIRTQRMHQYAEHGLAAHWLYKEMENTPVSARNADGFDTEESTSSDDVEEQTSVDEDFCLKYSCLKAGHPALRVEGSHLLAAVIISVNNNGKELLVAVSFGLGASEAVAERRTSFQLKRWEAHARLYKKVCDEWWFEPGHGDWCTNLEKYTLCRDGIYHKQDQFDRLLPTFIQVIQLSEKEESEYWAVVSAIFEGRDVDSIASSYENLTATMQTSRESNINNKVRLLRTMLQWEEELCSEVGVKGVNGYLKSQSRGNTPDFGEVAIVCWPFGDIMRLSAGSTAADAARRVGLEGTLVLVNGHLVLPSTELKDGDIVEVRL